MIQGLYTAANGMMAVEEQQAVVANNVANASTPGFKRQLAVQRGYYQAFFGETRNSQRLDQELAPGGGVKTMQTFTNYGNGAIRPTGGALDVALVGPGFLQVETDQGVRFTRSGQFSVGPGGSLITTEGYFVLDDRGAPIDVSGGAVRFDSEGNVFVDGRREARLGVIEVEDPHQLTREGYTLFAASEEVLATSRSAEATTVQPGSVEASNVQVPAEMASMMLALRAYAANQQVISAIDETADRMINQVGNPG